MAANLGLVIGSSLGPEQLASAAQRAEMAGFALDSPHNEGESVIGTLT